MVVCENIAVVGLGNPLLCDDTAGLKALDIIEKEAACGGGTRPVRCYSGGFQLMDALAGCDRAVIIDCVKTGSGPAGSCARFSLAQLDLTGQPRLADSHGLDLAEMVALGRACGLTMPREIAIIGIEGSDVETFSEDPTPAVAEGVRRAVDMTNDIIMEWRAEQ